MAPKLFFAALGCVAFLGLTTCGGEVEPTPTTEPTTAVAGNNDGNNTQTPAGENVAAPVVPYAPIAPPGNGAETAPRTFKPGIPEPPCITCPPGVAHPIAAVTK